MPNKKTLSPMDDQRLFDEEGKFIYFYLIKIFFILKVSSESYPVPVRDVHRG